MSDEQRTLRELAQLHGVQLSYTNVFRRRVAASVESTLAVLRALGAPVASLRDAPDALRARREHLGRRPLEPVVVAWEGRLGAVELRLPASAAGRDVEVSISPEDEEPGSWERASPVASGDALAGYVPHRLRLGRRLEPGRHELRIRTDEDEVGSATVLSAPRRCPQPGERWWGVFAPVYALRSQDDWGVGSFAELARFRGWVTGLGGSAAATLPL
ncbi:MAG TPA: 4-alpha-glucanotransferase, partial [Actinomycetota bacterium]|nr:4-alpha-glucanotransferase [Actinomycetota bacterium]